MDGPGLANAKVRDDGAVVLGFDHAQGGLVVGVIDAKNDEAAVPRVIAGDDGSALDLFYLIDENKVWHNASCKIVGSSVELKVPGLTKPKGWSYGSGGIGFQPNIYNKAMLPMTPFSVYDHKPVSALPGWEPPLKIAGYTPDPSEGGLLYAYRKMPILSTQFRDNAVLQHGKPVTIWGSAVHDWGLEAEGQAVIHFSFDGIEKQIPVKPGMKEWSVTLKPMKPSAEPKTLRVALTIDGELAHERIAEGIVVGDVWFIAAPQVKLRLPAIEPAKAIVRVMERQAKRDRFPRQSRYSVCVSTTPKNRFACYWKDAKPTTMAGYIAHKLAAQSGHPVGVIFMQSSTGKSGDNPPLKSWIPFHALADAPSLAEDYAKLGSTYPGSPSYNHNLRRYVADWKTYWAEYVPQMIETGKVPDASPWGVMPQLASKADQSEATQSYNVMVHSFTPATLKGFAFINTQAMRRQLGETKFNEQLEVLTRSMRARFGGDPIQMVIQVGDDPEAFHKTFTDLVEIVYRQR